MKLPTIHIIGLPGVGKTTLAKRLSKKFNIPIFGIGAYRVWFPMTAMGEADAWLALFRDISKRGWQDCILETTGLNKREHFLTDALPFDRMIVIKLEASRKILMERIGQKKKCEQGGKWLYSANFKDKYEFVKELYPSFKEIEAHFSIKTDQMTKDQVFRAVFMKIKNDIPIY
jgi:deoxyadenosine/deoxycytidine kinase